MSDIELCDFAGPAMLAVAAWNADDEGECGPASVVRAKGNRDWTEAAGEILKDETKPRLRARVINLLKRTEDEARPVYNEMVKSQRHEEKCVMWGAGGAVLTCLALPALVVSGSLVPAAILGAGALASYIKMGGHLGKTQELTEHGENVLDKGCKAETLLDEKTTPAEKQALEEKGRVPVPRRIKAPVFGR